MKFTPNFYIPVLFSISFYACNNSDKKVTEPQKDTVTIETKTPEVKKEAVEAVKPAIVNIVDTVSQKMTVIYMKDSAKVFERIGLKLGEIYGIKLAEVLKKNNIKAAGAPMAWYKSLKAPYFFEAGIPVTKRPAKIPNNVFVREMNADSVILAHFYGPYSLLGQGYDAIKERMKDEKKSSNGAPYEIYMDDPIDKEGKPVDPYKVRTDIVFPRK